MRRYNVYKKNLTDLPIFINKHLGECTRICTEGNEAGQKTENAGCATLRLTLESNCVPEHPRLAGGVLMEAHLFISIIVLFYLVCMGISPAYMSVPMCMTGTFRGQKGLSEPLELGNTQLSYHVGARN